MNKLILEKSLEDIEILENTLEDIEMAKTKLIPRIFHDFARYFDFLTEYKEIYDPNGARLEKLKKYFTFKEIGNMLYYTFDNNIQIIIIEVLLSLPFEMDKTRRKFRKYKNKFGYLCNQEKRIKQKIWEWKLDVKLIVDNIFYKDLSNLIMEYL